MKKFAAFIVALALFPAISFAAQTTGRSATNTATPAQTVGGRIYVVTGKVEVKQGSHAAHQVTDSEDFVPDTMVNTGEHSSALLKFTDGQIVTLQPNSSFHVVEYRYDPKQIKKSGMVLSMFQGGMRFVTGLIGQQRKQGFRLLTPHATIGIRGTEFMVAMADNSMYSQVLTGDIAVSNAAGTLALGAGQTAAVTSSNALATLVSASAIPAGVFTELLSIPIDPAAISSAIPPPPPAPALTLAPALAPTALPPVGIAAPGVATAGAAAGIAGAALAGMVGSDSKETPAPVASADESADTNSRSGIGLTGKIGTLGYGAELNIGFSDSLSTRIGANSYAYEKNANSGQVNYDFKLKLQTVSILADWYPFEGRFRTSAGLFYNNNKLGFGAKPTSGSYAIGSNSYSAANVGSLQGTMTFNKAAPYFGLGWGNPVARNKGLGMVSDIGVLFQGKPKTNLVATCGAALPAPQCTTLQNDAAAENAKLQEDLSNFKLWPVVSIGISYQW